MDRRYMPAVDRRATVKMIWIKPKLFLLKKIFFNKQKPNTLELVKNILMVTYNFFFKIADTQTFNVVTGSKSCLFIFYEH